ncbi:ECF RNA polymerase sigma factor SigK [Defluviimonas aquaemixtae]|uniref:ECF RNA polymerase sigma factor SigK n=1 Tax=Albidovulum aquaemixtae TaxID=1542388 RepID=A0A2R8B6H6_9RHOB|nr:sigma-70 family RNA polymerase sigma factor [Defluviimonas aquaemixtae]SPH18174.1 ECF RNA polymerase sigma factor SigK [Defluviimonas aquaemixtae]
MQSDDLESLVAAIGRRDREAFERFYREMEGPLFRFVRLKLNDPFRSADIVHEVFLEVWRGAGAFQKRSSVRTWVFAIAYRKVVDAFRQQGRLTFEEEVPEQIDSRPDAEACLLAAQQSQAIRLCLDTLKAEHRLAIELTFYEDMSYRDISSVTGVPEGTVKSRVFHAKQLLMRCLSARLKAEMR